MTLGDMDVLCTSGSKDCYLPPGTAGVLSTSTQKYKPAFKSASGWDFSTGLGSVDAANLVNGWPK